MFVQDVKIFAAIGFTLLLVVIALFYEVAVWRECLGDYSWWYCLRILSAR
jgi:hypothetical protein